MLSNGVNILHEGKHVLVKTGMGNPYDRGMPYILGKISLTARYKKSEVRAVCDGDSGHSLKPLSLKSSALLIGVLNLFRAKGHNCKGLDERGRLKTF